MPQSLEIYIFDSGAAPFTKKWNIRRWLCICYIHKMELEHTRVYFPITLYLWNSCWCRSKQNLKQRSHCKSCHLYHHECLLVILSLCNYQAWGQNSPFILPVIPRGEHSMPTHLPMQQDCRFSLNQSSCRKNSNTNTSVLWNCLKGPHPNKHSKVFSSSIFFLFPVFTSRNFNRPNKL